MAWILINTLNPIIETLSLKIVSRIRSRKPQKTCELHSRRRLRTSTFYIVLSNLMQSTLRLKGTHLDEIENLREELLQVVKQFHISRGSMKGAITAMSRIG